MIEMLNKIGLSDLEARCYLTLLEEPDLSGYEVAKRVSVSRSNVYAALRSLSDKGACRQRQTDPILYDAIPIAQLVKVLKADFEQTAKKLVDHLNSVPRKVHAFYNWQGKDPISTTINRLVANADSSIIVDLWAEDIHWVEEALLEAEHRGVKVTVITMGECPTQLRHVIVHARDENWSNVEARKFSLMCDATVSLIGSFGATVKLSAVETDHPAISELLKNNFVHDMIMQQIERDFGEELTLKYGSYYRNFITSFIEQSGLSL